MGALASTRVKEVTLVNAGKASREATVSLAMGLGVLIINVNATMGGVVG
jgi:hypothetical protein